MAAESKDLFAFRRGFTDLLPNRSLDYARDDSLVRNLKQLVKLQFLLPAYNPAKTAFIRANGCGLLFLWGCVMIVIGKM